MLTDKITFTVPFYDMDALSVVWHGNYVKYLEQGRESFGKKFGLEYKRVYDKGFIIPVADMHIRYLAPAQAGDTLRLETSLKLDRAAKLHFFYNLFKDIDNQLIMQAETTQLFVSVNGDFTATNPPFFAEWKKKMENTYFFFASKPEKTDENYKIEVELNDECAVYKGHFPGNPISPGVCNMNMIRQCAEQITGARLRIKEIAHCRFLALITPKTEKYLTVNISFSEEENSTFTIIASICDNSGKIFVDFKGKMIKI